MPLQPAGCASPTPTPRPLDGSVSPLIARSALAGHHPAGAGLAPALVLRPGTAAADRAAVERFMLGQGFALQRRYRADGAIRFRGTVDLVEQTFGTTINEYQFRGRTFFANSGQIVLPPAIAPHVSAVLGLHNSTRMQPAARKNPSSARAAAKPAAPGVVEGPAGLSGQPGPTPPYTPAQLQRFYGLDALNAQGFNGAGRKIGIVTFAKLNNRDDLNVDVRPFEDAFGLPHSRVTFRVDPDEPFPSTDALDSEETTLDVSWASAMAPGADLYVEEASIEGGNVGFADAIEDLVSTYDPDVISISWSGCFVTPNDMAGLDSVLANVTVPVLVASGDGGSTDCDGHTGPEWPASDPYVTAVGGTSLTPDNLGNPSTELVWSNGAGASGGGFSSVFPRPAWQQAAAAAAGLTAGGRGVPDVALLADPLTGYALHDAVGRSTWTGVGGTSGAAPALAGVIATIDQALGSRKAITEPVPLTPDQSFNRFFYTYACPASNCPYNAIGSGGHWDSSVGLGSINANRLFAAWSGQSAKPTPAPTLAPGSGTFDDAIPTPSPPYPFSYPVTFSPAGDWLHDSAVSGATNAAGLPDGTMSVALLAGDTVYFEFSGTGVTFVYETNADGGIAGAVIDGKAPSAIGGVTGPDSIDQYSAVPTFNTSTTVCNVCTTWSNLPAGNHTLTISATGAANPANVSGLARLYVGSFSPLGGATPTPVATASVTASATAAPTATGTPAAASIRVFPASGVPGTTVTITGSGFAVATDIAATFTDAGSPPRTTAINGCRTSAAQATATPFSGGLRGAVETNATLGNSGCSFTVPAGAAPGLATITVSDGISTVAASFIVGASGTAFTVNDTTDGPGSCAPGGTCTLREAVNEANALPAGSSVSITLQPGATYFLTAPLAFTGFSTFTLSGDAASPAALDGSSGGTPLTQALTIAKASSVVLSNITIQNATAGTGDGGAIANHGTLTLNTVTVRASAGGKGGGIFNDGALTLNQSTVGGAGAGEANTATCCGGGIYSSGTLVLNASHVDRNTSAGDGGGIFNDVPGRVSLLAGSTVSGNTGSQGGGMDNRGTAVVDSAQVTANQATNFRGGGIASLGQLTITGSASIDGNQAPNDHGGGVYSAGTLTISGKAAITNNTSGFDGGGVYNEGAMSMTSGLVTGNASVTGRGGGLSNTGQATLSNVTVGSTASPNHADLGGGGGVYSRGSLTLTDSHVDGNVAGYAGGLWNENPDGPVTITGSTITGNTALAGEAGGIENGDMLVLTNSVVSRNHADALGVGGGGGIYNTGYAVLNGSTVGDTGNGDGNTALFGAGIVDFGQLVVVNSSITGNAAALEAGGIYYEGQALTVTNSTLSGNSAITGAALYVEERSVDMNAVTVAFNTAPGDAALTVSSFGSLNIRNSIVAGGGSSTGACLALGTVVDQRRNLDTDGTCGFETGLASPPTTADLFETAAPADHGGPTLTLSLANSGANPAIDAIPAGANPAAQARRAGSGAAGGAPAGGRAAPATAGRLSTPARPTTKPRPAATGTSRPRPFLPARVPRARLEGRGAPDSPERTARTAAQPAARPSAASASGRGTSQAVMAAIVPALSGTVCGNGMPDTDQRGTPRPQGAACDIGAFEAASAAPPPPLTATMHLSASSAMPGAVVVISGSGFAPGALAVSFGGTLTGAQLTAACSASTAGQIASGCEFHVPSATAPGSGSVTVSDGALNSPTATINVATFVVNTQTDASDVSAGDGACATVDGQCSLRAAIEEINALAPLNGAPIALTISLPAGQYTLTMGMPLSISTAASLTIAGAGAGVSRIDGNDQSTQVLVLPAGSSATLSGVTLQNGSSAGDGGAISNEGTLALNNAEVVSSVATGSGGGIANSGSLTLTASSVTKNSTFSGDGGGISNTGVLAVNGGTVGGNLSTANGGGIANMGQLTIAGQAQVSGNSADFGGGLYNAGQAAISGQSQIAGNEGFGDAGGLANTGTMTITDSQVNENISDASAGGVHNTGTLAINNSQVSRNVAGADVGGGIHNSDGGSLTLNNSEVSGNTASLAGGIFNSAQLTAGGSTVANNTAGSAGGIRNEGTAALSSMAVTGNHATGDGAGVWNAGGGQMLLTSSTVRGNIASTGVGGGLYNEATLFVVGSTIAENGGNGIAQEQGTLDLANVTLVRNTQAFDGAALFVDASSGAVSMNAVTVTDNSNSSGGSGLATLAGPIQARNSIIAASPATGTAACAAGALADLGYNLDSDGTCALAADTSLPGLDPMLDSSGLAANGGPTMTVALLAGSPAINAIPDPSRPSASVRRVVRPATARRTGPAPPPRRRPPGTAPALPRRPARMTAAPVRLAARLVMPALSSSLCANGAPDVDARGIQRPQGSGCDIGAYEAPATVSGAGGSLALSSSIAAPGSGVTVSGGGFSSGGVSLTFMGSLATLSSINCPVLTDGTIDSANCSFSVPSDVSGPGSVVVSDGSLALSATFTVAATHFTVAGSANADTGDANAGDGVCDDGSGSCSLRAAIDEMNAEMAALIAPTAFFIDLPAPAAFSITSDLVINPSGISGLALTVQGSGSGSTVISAGSQSRVFSVQAGSTVIMSGLTLQNGSTPDAGGVIENLGTLTLENAIVSGGAAVNGGGIHNSGTLTLRSASVSGGSANSGGGIFNEGVLTMSNSVLTGNSASMSSDPASGEGGGLTNTGLATIDNSTVDGNSAEQLGGGVHNAGTLSATYSTFNSNTAVAGSSLAGGGIYNAGALSLTSTEVSGNSATANGAGIFNDGGQALLSGVTLGGNNATAQGGGIDNEGQLTIMGSTIGDTTGGKANSATLGGAIYTDNGRALPQGASLTLINSTLAGNSAGVDGAAIFLDAGAGRAALNAVTVAYNTAAGAAAVSNASAAAVSLQNSIIAGDPSTAACSAGAVNDLGYNLNTDASCGLTAVTSTAGPVNAGDVIDGGLTTTGGAAPTIKLVGTAGTNPAIDAIPASSVSAQARRPRTQVASTAGVPRTPPKPKPHSVARRTRPPAVEAKPATVRPLVIPGVPSSVCANGAPDVDQRGVTRPQGSGCDVGAYEAAATTPPATVRLSRAAAARGATVSVGGSGFDAGTLTVTFGGSLSAASPLTCAADATGAIADGCVFTVPSNASGQGTVAVDDAGSAHHVQVSFTAGALVADTPTDDPAADCSTAGRCSLRAAVSLANAAESDFTIVLLPITYLLSSDDVHFAPSFPVTLSGAGMDASIIDGGSQYRLIVDSGVLTLSGLTIQHGFGCCGGGAIENYGQLTLTNVKVAATYSDSDGGGLASYQGSVTINASSVTGNTATARGGGIFNDVASTLWVTGSLIEGNNGYQGAGIYNLGQMTVQDSTVRSNSSSSFGGGIANTGSQASITGSRVTGNSAQFAGGGGIYNDGSLTIASSQIGSNSSESGDGGGLYNDVDASASISASQIDGNSSSEGGGLENEGKLDIVDSSVSSNVSTGDAGGIDNEGMLTLVGSRVNGNSAYEAGGVENEGTLSITGSSVNNNQSSTDAGGIDNEGPLTVTQSEVSGNAAVGLGGGISNFDRLDMTGSRVTGNASAVDGGGIYNGWQLTLGGSLVSDNTAEIEGGGIYNDSHAVLSGGRIERNTARGAGGGLYNQSQMTIANMTVSGNRAGNAGGGVYNAWQLVGAASTISGNSSGQDGAGIFEDGDALTLTNSTIAGNASGPGYNGGAVLVSMGPTSLNAVTAAGNSASGAALANPNGVAVQIQNSIVAGMSDTLACQGPVVDLGYNLFGDGTCSVASGASQAGADAMLGALTDNGGPTQTLMPQPGSPALAAIPAAANIVSQARRAGPPPFSDPPPGRPSSARRASNRSHHTRSAAPLWKTPQPPATRPQVQPAARPRLQPLAMPPLGASLCGNGGPDTDQRGTVRPQGPNCSIGAVEGTGIVLSSVSGPPGTVISIGGGGFKAGPLSGVFAGQTFACSAGSLGAIAGGCSVTVPAGTPTGGAVVSLTDGANTALKTFTVTFTGVSGSASGPNPVISIVGQLGSLSASAVGAGTLTIAENVANPAGSFPATSGFIDVQAPPGNTFSSLTIQDCDLAPGATLVYWWNGTSWLAASDQVASGACITVTITGATSPSIADLTGTPFVAGPLPTPTPAPTDTPAPTATGTATPTPSETPTATVTATATASATAGPSGTPTPTASPAATETPTVTGTAAPSETPTAGSTTAPTETPTIEPSTTTAPANAQPAQAPPPSTTAGQPGTSSVGATGSLVVVGSSTSASGGATVIGPAAPNTGVADLPAGFVIPSLTAGGVSTNEAPPISPDSITGTAPAPISAVVSASTGGIVLAGNVAVVIPPAALAGVAGGQLSVNVTTNPAVTVPGGPAQFSPNGTILAISFKDGNGNLVTTFPTKIPIEMKYNAADVGQANGNANLLTAAYVIDEDSPAIENPLGFPVGTFVIFPPENVSTNTVTGTVTAYTQALGSTVSVVTNPVGYVQTLVPDAAELSSFDANNAQTFGTKPQFTTLQVVEPQIGNRLLVLDPDTGNYAYVNAGDVAPSGPPAGKTSAGVVRGLLEGARDERSGGSDGLLHGLLDRR